MAFLRDDFSIFIGTCASVALKYAIWQAVVELAQNTCFHVNHSIPPTPGRCFYFRVLPEASRRTKELESAGVILIMHSASLYEI